ncbi:MAG: hypothetical protein EPN43_05560 [Jatrophihabitans sp.]|nr:MAG: hypothetical protein EPN43_05560 [Jatrophihabitans sp.]
MAGYRHVRRVLRFLQTRPTRRQGWNWAIWAVAAIVLVSIAATGGHGTAPAAGSGAGSAAVATGSPGAPPRASAPQHSPSTPGRAAAADAPPEPSGTTATTGADVLGAGGAVLPNPGRTPGAVNPAVTQSDIDSTICVTGWTATVRPPSSETTALKEQQLATGYAYRGDTNPGDYEEDHLISLELGGSPASPLNLWPEPYAAPDGARTKDLVENKLRELVCSGEITLASAQRAIATDWFVAYERYVGAPAAPPTTGGNPASAVGAPAAPPPGVAATCTASMSVSDPSQNSTTDVIVSTGVPGAQVSATAHYKSTDTTRTGVAGSDGTARIPFDVGRATMGYQVQVEVTVSANGSSRSCGTAFTPQ